MMFPRPAGVTTALPYLTPHVILGGMACGLAAGEYGVCRIAASFWITVVFLDLLCGPRRARSLESSSAKKDGSAVLWSVLSWLLVSLYLLLLLSGFWIIGQGALSFRELLVVTVTVGFTGAIFAIPAAHELMHHSDRFARGAASLVMMSFGYGHFSIEHRHGHHRNVATPRDPATARLGESFYEFHGRVIAGSLAGAWRIEQERLRRRGLPVFGFANRALRCWAIQVVLYASVAVLVGWQGLVFMILVGVIGLSTLEIINYIQHYGLVRREVSPGEFEPVGPAHAWNSDHPISNWLLFNLPQHAAHHCPPNSAFGGLHHAVEAPRLPLGYFPLFWLALLPPVWRRVMNPRVAAWRENNRSMSVSRGFRDAVGPSGPMIPAVEEGETVR